MKHFALPTVLLALLAAPAEAQTSDIDPSTANATIDVEVEVIQQRAPIVLDVVQPLTFRGVYTPNGLFDGHTCVYVQGADGTGVVRELDSTGSLVDGGASGCRTTNPPFQGLLEWLYIAPQSSLSLVSVSCLKSQFLYLRASWQSDASAGPGLQMSTPESFQSLLPLPEAGFFRGIRALRDEFGTEQTASGSDSVGIACGTDGKLTVRVGAAIVVGADLTTGDYPAGTITLTANY
jgi:hypothetical protein